MRNFLEIDKNLIIKYIQNVKLVNGIFIKKYKDDDKEIRILLERKGPSSLLKAYTHLEIIYKNENISLKVVYYFKDNIYIFDNNFEKVYDLSFKNTCIKTSKSKNDLLYYKEEVEKDLENFMEDVLNGTYQ